jgi:hypothetical protein
MSYIAKNGRLYTSGASEALTLLDDKFSVNKSYSKGDSCIYNDYLWKFTSDKPAGEWNPSVVEQCRIMDFVDDVNGRLTQTEVDEKIRFDNALPSGGFVCPSDGYIYAYNNTSGVTTGIEVNDSKGKNITYIILNGRMGTPLYVRKGMIITDSKDIKELPKIISFTPFKA